MGNPEKGSAYLACDPYFASVHWEPKMVIINSRKSTMQETEYFKKVEFPRPIDAEQLSDVFKTNGLPERNSAALIKSIREVLREI